MHKVFYASGFLYHLKTQQILLHQPLTQNPQISSQWQMFEGMSQRKEIAPVAFQRIIHEMLRVQLDMKRVFPVYDYFHYLSNKSYFILYAEVKNITQFFPPKGSSLSWFTFKQTLKLPFTQQTKHDIIVAERVIKAQARSMEIPQIAHQPS